MWSVSVTPVGIRQGWTTAPGPGPGPVVGWSVPTYLVPPSHYHFPYMLPVILGGSP